MEWLKFLMEDILRLSKEKKRPLTVGDVVKDSKVEKDDVLQAVEKLGKEDMASFEGKRIHLTHKGEKIAEVIYKQHKTAERIFGHSVAHVLEHLGSATKKIEILKGKTKSIEEFKENEEGLLAFLSIENPKIISRLLGVGLSPGRPFRIVKIREDIIILEINNRLIVIDRKLGKNIMGVSKVESPSHWSA